MRLRSVSRQGRAIFAGCAALLLAACMTRPPAPVYERTPSPVSAIPPAPAASAPAGPSSEPAGAPVPTYTVKRGDTLRQIAVDNGLDYRELAAWNNIDNLNVIRPGQTLRLRPPGEPGSEAGAAAVVVTPLRTPGPDKSAAPASTSAPNASANAPNTSANAPNTIASSNAPPASRSNTAAYKTEPKAIKLPYSDAVLAQLQRTPSAMFPPVAESASPAGSAAPGNGAPPASLPAAAPAPSAASPATAASPAPGASGPAGQASTAATAGGAAAAPSTAGPSAPREDSGRVPEIDDDKLGWLWPTTGKVVGGFSETANLKGIDIAGKAGQPVRASAAGKVVYAGAGLRGYGKLIIIKHNKTYLSAYAHNREILVKEGQLVAKGQQVAEMGDSDADQVKLHFEIRRLGKPVDPTRFLPPA